MALESCANRADILLHALGSSLSDAHAAQMVPVLTNITADHGSVHIVWLLTYTQQLLLVLLIVAVPLSSGTCIWFATM